METFLYRPKNYVDSLLNLWVRFYPVKQNKFDRVSLTLETSLPSAEQGLYVVTFVEAIE